MSVYDFFLFTESGHHRDLHSFPTRRSSDLHPDVQEAAVVGVPHVVLGEDVGAFVVCKPGASLDEAALTDFCAERDRKSTRLNSSHTVISYAVFCLKKKKKYRARN